MVYYRSFKDIILNMKISLASGFAVRTLGAYSTSANQETAWKSAKPFSEIPSLPMLPVVGTAWHYMPIVGKCMKKIKIKVGLFLKLYYYRLRLKLYYF